MNEKKPFPGLNKLDVSKFMNSTSQVATVDSFQELKDKLMKQSGLPNEFVIGNDGTASIKIDDSNAIRVNDMEVSEWLVNQMKDRLLNEVDFVNAIRSNGTAPAFRDSEVGRGFEERISRMEIQVRTMQKILENALEKIDVFLRGFSLPD